MGTFKDWIGSPPEWGTWGTQANAWFNKVSLQLNNNGDAIVTNAADIDTLEALHNRPYTYGARASGTQSIPLSTPTPLTGLTTVSNGAGAGFSLSGGRLRAGSGDGGIWWVQGQVFWASNTTGYRALYIAKNQTVATGIHGGSYESTIMGTSRVHQVSGVFSVVANDYLDMVVWQNSGGALNVTGEATRLHNITAYKLFD